jgi:hypothetical protein
MTAAPQPVARTEKAQQTTKQSGAVKAAFGAAVKALTQRAPKPAAPKKTARKRSGEDDKGRIAFVRKQTRRVFRKVARRVSDDERDERPTFDAHSFHQHQQRVADIGSTHEQERGFRSGGPNYPSPTL